MKHLKMLKRVIFYAFVAALGVRVVELENQLTKFRPVHIFVNAPPNDSEGWSEQVTIPKYWICRWDPPSKQDPTLLANEKESIVLSPSGQNNQELVNDNVETLRFRSGAASGEKIPVWLLPPNYLGLQAADDVEVVGL